MRLLKGGNLVSMNRTGHIQVLDFREREKALYPVAYGSKVMVKEGHKVKKGDVLLEWDPFANAILTKEAGRAELKDLEENL